MSSSDRKPYESAIILSQSLLDYCADNLENKLEMICEIETPDGIIYASDRNKYVGGTFYQALLNFPVINRTIGEWLSPELQFSTLTLELSNVDGRFNNYLPGGDDFDGWIGKSVIVKMGISEVLATYTTIFKGVVTDVGGFKRSVKSVTVIARDQFDKINQTFPRTVLAKTSYPKLAEGNIGKTVPIIYGTWNEGLDPDPAIVPTFCTNGNDPLIDYKDRIFTVTIATPGVFTCNEHNLENGDIIQLDTSGALPSPLTSGTDYYVKNVTGNLTFNLSTSPGGSSINTSGSQSGIHKFIASPTATARNVALVIAENNLDAFDIDNVYLKRNDLYTRVPISQIPYVAVSNKNFEVKQRSGILWVDDGEGTLIEYAFDSSDEFYVRVTGEDLASYTDNLIEQSKHILKTFGGLVDGDFSSSWATYRSKSTPSESAIVNFKSRVWIAEQQGALSYALSMLEQVRLECFVDRNLKLSLSSLHFDEFDATPSYSLKNWDIERDSLQVSVDDRNNFNRAQGVYNFSPIRNENSRATKIYKNSDSITQVGKEISKKLVFPNLYEETVVIAQLTEILKISSAMIEIIAANVTWRALLLDISQFLSLDITIGSCQYSGVPAIIREIGYDPAGLKLPVKLWSFQMSPFSGYEPGYAGTVGGFDATIISE
jgi:hypothetical protein